MNFEPKSVLTISWNDETAGSEERVYTDIVEFVETYEDRKSQILFALPVTHLANLYHGELKVEKGTDHQATLLIYHHNNFVATAEFITVLKCGNSYFELQPIRINPSIK